ncbi:MAG: hypothetical protein CL565_00615 [Alphaproteobacteria bacterium]|nr:hypothetical protein [Alphaproteobacteria bacterium]|tara:strand:+ start:338 stop:1174 length:837 start_codon:yes stop_codon:yes gene_type:complete
MSDREDILYKSGDKTAGDILRETRELDGISIADVAAYTKIPVKNLRAIEENNDDDLPSPIYVVGFIKTYASYLGLVGEDMAELYKMKNAGRHFEPELNLEAKVDTETYISNRWLLFICLCSLFAFSIVYNTLGKNRFERDSEQYSIPEVPDSVRQDLTANSRKLAALLEEEEVRNRELKESIEKGIHIVAIENIWIQVISDTSPPLYSGVLKKGEVFQLPKNLTGYTLTTGDAASTSIQIDEALWENIGEKGDVIRDIPLDREQLRDYLSGVSTKKVE